MFCQGSRSLASSLRTLVWACLQSGYEVIAILTSSTSFFFIFSAFQAVLSGSNALETHNAVSAGSAIVDLTETGGLEFKVNIV